jgi:predicted RNase H-like nuclease
MQTERSASGSPWVGGADGIRGGWFVVLWRPATGTVRRRTVDDVEALLAVREQPAILGVDMVIGCPDRAEPGGRPCDRQARQLLGHPRGASVFSPPAYDALGAETYDEAQRRNRASGPDAPGLAKQAFYLLPKMHALAERMTPTRQEQVREVHPELAFYAMNGNTAVEASKHDADGRTIRADLLEAHGIPDIREAVEARTDGPVGADDVLDAHAVCWTARRIHEGTADRCPPTDESAPRNDRGLRMEIWR